MGFYILQHALISFTRKYIYYCALIQISQDSMQHIKFDQIVYLQNDYIMYAARAIPTTWRLRK